MQIGCHMVQLIAFFVPHWQQSKHNHQVTSSVLCKLQVNWGKPLQQLPPQHGAHWRQSTHLCKQCSLLCNKRQPTRHLRERSTMTTITGMWHLPSLLTLKMMPLGMQKACIQTLTQMKIAFITTFCKLSTCWCTAIQVVVCYSVITGEVLDRIWGKQACISFVSTQFYRVCCLTTTVTRTSRLPSCGCAMWMILHLLLLLALAYGTFMSAFSVSIASWHFTSAFICKAAGL